MARCSTPSFFNCASRRWISTGSGVVCDSGISPFGPTTPTVPRLAAGLPSAVQISRRNATTEDLPLVPVTAATSSGLGGEKGGGITRQAGAGIVVGDEGHAQRLGLRRRIGMRQHGAGAALHRIGDEARAVGLAPRKRREQVTRLDLAAVAGYAGEIFCRHHGDCSFLPGTIRENCGAIMNCCAPP